MHNARMSINKKPRNRRFKGQNTSKQDKKNKLYKEGKCFCCKKPRHLTSKYLDKPKNTPSRFSIITTLENALN